MRRNAELEAKSGKAAKNAEMILNSTTTPYKENSFLDNFHTPSGPETIVSSTVSESADNAAIKHQTPPQSPYRKTPPMSPEVQKQQSVAQKNIEDLRYSNGRTPQLRATAHPTRPHQGKAAVPKVTVAASRSDISLDSTPQSSVMTEATFRYQKARIVVLEEECLRAKEAMKAAEKERKVATGICRQ